MTLGYDQLCKWNQKGKDSLKGYFFQAIVKNDKLCLSHNGEHPFRDLYAHVSKMKNPALSQVVLF